MLSTAPTHGRLFPFSRRARVTASRGTNETVKREEQRENLTVNSLEAGAAFAELIRVASYLHDPGRNN